MEYIIPAQSGVGFTISKGQTLIVSCIEDEQVADLVTYNVNNSSEFLSNGKTFDYCESVKLTKGHTLYSNMSNPMLTIIEDTCGVHDFLLAPCCPKTMEIFYGMEGNVPTCRENLFSALKHIGISRWDIPTAFNIFMNVPIADDGTIKVMPPEAKAGDFIRFRAEMDMHIGLTACSASASNNGSYKPIGYSVI